MAYEYYFVHIRSWRVGNISLNRVIRMYTVAVNVVANGRTCEAVLMCSCSLSTKHAVYTPLKCGAARGVVHCGTMRRFRLIS